MTTTPKKPSEVLSEFEDCRTLHDGPYRVVTEMWFRSSLISLLFEAKGRMSSKGITAFVGSYDNAEAFDRGIDTACSVLDQLIEEINK